MRLKRYEAIAVHIRDQGPMTIPEIAASMRCSEYAAEHSVRRARSHMLLMRIGKNPTGHVVFGATQTMAERT